MRENEKESTVWSFSKRGVIFSDQNIFPANIHFAFIVVLHQYRNDG
jgi:hypothetical protein